MPNVHVETLGVADASQNVKPCHPLESLNASEVEQAVGMLKSQAGFTSSMRIISVVLKEPNSESVHEWPNSASADRCAIAELLDNAANNSFTITLNLTKSEIVNVQNAPPDSQPTLSLDEQIECEQAVLESPEFLAVLNKQYGIADTSPVMVDIWSAGNYGSDEDRMCERRSNNRPQSGA